jgi:hypothetical protein
MKTLRTTLVLAFAAIASTASAASANFTGSYSQNFDSLGQSGTTAPTGWSFVSEAGSHDTFTPADDSITKGVLPNLTAGTLTANATLVAVTGPTTQKANQGYNFGLASTPTDRALGTSPTGTAASILELSLTNTTGAALNAIKVGYNIRRFSTTVNNNTAYAGGNYGAIEELPGYQLFYNLNGGTWTNVSSLNPTLSGSNGVVVPNSIGMTTVTPTWISLSSAWSANGTLTLAWLDDNAQGPSPDQLLGLDNVTVIPEPSTYAAILGALTIGFVAIRRRRASQVV